MFHVEHFHSPLDHSPDIWSCPENRPGTNGGVAQANSPVRGLTVPARETQPRDLAGKSSIEIHVREIRRWGIMPICGASLESAAYLWHVANVPRGTLQIFPIGWG